MAASCARPRALLCKLAALLSALLCCSLPSSATAAPVLTGGGGEHEAGFFTAGPRGATFAFSGGAEAKFRPGARFKLFPTPQDLQLSPGRPTPTWSIALISGHADLVVPKAGAAALLTTMSEQLSVVTTQGLTSVIATPGDVAIANIDGQAQTIIKGRWSALSTGVRRTVDRGGRAAEDRSLLSPTTIADGQRVWVAAPDTASLGGFRWEPVADATGYEVVLQNAESGETVETRKTAKAELLEPLGPVKPGIYSLAVRAIDSFGLWGTFSEKTRIHVLGVNLPEGAYISPDGAIRLGEGQKVFFTHTNGLELTHTGARRHFPASEGVALWERAKTIVSFRMPGSLESTIARLRPRGIHADIELGPTLATWPRDTVHVRVRVRDERGLSTNGIDPVPSVMLGVTPLAVEWRRHDDALVAEIPPQTGDGPWVIRVEVRDQHGIMLGRNFLEVVRSPRPLARPLRGAH